MPLGSPSVDSLSETVAAAPPDALGDRLADATDNQRDSHDSAGDYGCEPAFSTFTNRPNDDTVTLAVDAGDCPHRGSLSTSAPCCTTIVKALETHDVDQLVIRADGLKRRYGADATDLLVAAGRFAERVRFHDDRLVDHIHDDPFGAAHRATGRAGSVCRAAVKTGFAEGASRSADYSDALWAVIGPTLARSRVDPRSPTDGRLVKATDLGTDAVARRYECPRGPVYYLTPLESTLDQRVVRTLEATHDRLTRGIIDVGPRTPGRAVRLAANADAPVGTLTAILAKHATGNGTLDDLFSNPVVSDVYVSTLADENPIRVVANDISMPTGVRLAPDGAELLASRLRRVNGASLSHADPTLDTVVEAGGASVRVAGVTAPASDGLGFAFRRHDKTPLTLPALIASGTLSTGAAMLCLLAVERGVSVPVADSHGAGKTTFLGSFPWELPRDVRTMLIEDTLGLPASSLLDADHDVQSLRTDTTSGPEPTPQEALHAALQLDDGTLALGGVRGEEAAILYEAACVGANTSAVLGTIHGDRAADVRERVVSDLGVPASSFAATDLVVTCEHADGHRVARVEEVRPVGDDAALETLSRHDGRTLEPTGSVARSGSLAVESLARPGRSCADVLDALDTHATHLVSLAETERTAPNDLTAAHAERGSEC